MNTVLPFLQSKATQHYQSEVEPKRSHADRASLSLSLSCAGRAELTRRWRWRWPQVYALVAREKTVLAEFTASSGNFPTVTRVLLAKIPPADGRMSYVYDKCGLLSMRLAPHSR